MLESKEIFFNILLILSFLFGIFLIFYSFFSKKESKLFKGLFFIVGILFMLCAILYKFNIVSKVDLEIIYPFISIMIVSISMFLNKKK